MFSTASAPAPRSRGAALRRGPGPLGAPAQRRTYEAEVLVTATGQLSVPSVRPSRASTFSGPPSTPRAGATTTTYSASGWRWSARAPAPSSSSRRSRPVGQLDVYQRAPWLDVPQDRLPLRRARRPVRAAADRAAAGPRVRRTPSRSSPRSGFTRPAAAAPVPARCASPHPQGFSDPELREGDADRCDRLQAGPAHRRVVSDADPSQCRAGHLPIAEVPPTRSAPRRPRAPRRHPHLATGFASTPSWRPCRSRVPGGESWPTAWAEDPGAYVGSPSPDSPTCSCSRPQHQRRQRVGGQHDRVRREPRDRRAPRRWSARGRAGSSEAAPPPSASTPSCAARSPERSGTQAAPTGTSTSAATTPASGPGRGPPTAGAPREARAGRLRAGRACARAAARRLIRR